ncbi:MAG: hypothetical protein ACPGJV_13430 [Bacteriovoracaceae bacterium]
MKINILILCWICTSTLFAARTGQVEEEHVEDKQCRPDEEVFNNETIEQIGFDYNKCIFNPYGGLITNQETCECINKADGKTKQLNERFKNYDDSRINAVALRELGKQIHGTYLAAIDNINFIDQLFSEDEKSKYLPSIRNCNLSSFLTNLKNSVSRCKNKELAQKRFNQLFPGMNLEKIEEMMKANVKSVVDHDKNSCYPMSSFNRRLQSSDIGIRQDICTLSLNGTQGYFNDYSSQLPKIDEDSETYEYFLTTMKLNLYGLQASTKNPMITFSSIQSIEPSLPEGFCDYENTEFDQDPFNKMIQHDKSNLENYLTSLNGFCVESFGVDTFNSIICEENLNFSNSFINDILTTDYYGTLKEVLTDNERLYIAYNRCNSPSVESMNSIDKFVPGNRPISTHEVDIISGNIIEHKDANKGFGFNNFMDQSSHEVTTTGICDSFLKSCNGEYYKSCLMDSENRNSVFSYIKNGYGLKPDTIKALEEAGLLSEEYYLTGKKISIDEKRSLDIDLDDLQKLKYVYESLDLISESMELKTEAESNGVELTNNPDMTQFAEFDEDQENSKYYLDYFLNATDQDTESLAVSNIGSSTDSGIKSQTSTSDNYVYERRGIIRPREVETVASTNTQNSSPPTEPLSSTISSNESKGLTLSGSSRKNSSIKTNEYLPQIAANTTENSGSKSISFTKDSSHRSKPKAINYSATEEDIDIKATDNPSKTRTSEYAKERQRLLETLRSLQSQMAQTDDAKKRRLNSSINDLQNRIAALDRRPASTSSNRQGYAQSNSSYTSRNPFSQFDRTFVSGNGDVQAAQGNEDDTAYNDEGTESSYSRGGMSGGGSIDPSGKSSGASSGGSGSDLFGGMGSSSISSIGNSLNGEETESDDYFNDGFDFLKTIPFSLIQDTDGGILQLVKSLGLEGYRIRIITKEEEKNEELIFVETYDYDFGKSSDDTRYRKLVIKLMSTIKKNDESSIQSVKDAYGKKGLVFKPQRFQSNVFNKLKLVSKEPSCRNFNLDSTKSCITDDELDKIIENMLTDDDYNYLMQKNIDDMF